MKMEASGNKEDGIFFGAASFILPVLILLVIFSRGNDSLMTSIVSTAGEADKLRTLISSGNIYIPEVLSEILACHLCPSFILSLLFGGFAAKIILTFFFYIRFQLMSLGIYLICRKHLKLPPLMCALLGICYSLSPISLTASVNPSIHNVMVIMPFAVCGAVNLMVKCDKADMWLMAGLFSLFTWGGFTGVLAGLVFMVSMGPLLKSLMPEYRFTSVVKAYLISLIAQIPVIVPALTSGVKVIDIKKEFTDSTVTFKFFDLLTSALDGNAAYVPDAGSYVTMNLSVLVLMLVLLFFLNRKIPYKAKLAGLLIILLIAASASSSLVNAILSVYGNVSTAAVSRLSVLSLCLMVMAGVSLCNIRECARNEVFITAAFLLAVIMVSNSSMAGEVGRSAFYLWFSAGAVVFWSVCILLILDGKDKAVKVMSILGSLGILVNIWYCFSISGFDGTLPSVSTRENTFSVLPLMEVDSDFPLYGDSDEYICIRSDLRETESDLYIPGYLNILSNLAVQDVIFVRADSFAVFTDGVADRGDGFFSSPDSPPSYEILVRCENMDPSSRYYLYSTFGGINTLTETYSGQDFVSEISGPYIRQLSRLFSNVSLRQTGSFPSQNERFILWKENGDALEAFREHVDHMEGFGADLSSYTGPSVDGYMTVVTSVPYSDWYEIRIDSDNGRLHSQTYNFAGRLAVTFDTRASSGVSFKITSPDAVPAVMTFVWVLSSGIILYNILISKKTDRVKDSC